MTTTVQMSSDRYKKSRVFLLVSRHDCHVSNAGACSSIHLAPSSSHSFEFKISAFLDLAISKTAPFYHHRIGQQQYPKRIKQHHDDEHPSNTRIPTTTRHHRQEEDGPCRRCGVDRPCLHPPSSTDGTASRGQVNGWSIRIPGGQG